MNILLQMMEFLCQSVYLCDEGYTNIIISSLYVLRIPDRSWCPQYSDCMTLMHIEEKQWVNSRSQCISILSLLSMKQNQKAFSSCVFSHGRKQHLTTACVGCLEANSVVLEQFDLPTMALIIPPSSPQDHCSPNLLHHNS